jgi:hypothetical protein
MFTDLMDGEYDDCNTDATGRIMLLPAKPTPEQLARAREATQGDDQSLSPPAHKAP